MLLGPAPRTARRAVAGTPFRAAARIAFRIAAVNPLSTNRTRAAGRRRRTQVAGTPFRATTGRPLRSARHHRGRHRRPARRPGFPRPFLREPQHTMHLVMTGLGALIIAGIVGLTAFFVLAEELRAATVPPSGAPAPPPVLGSRQLDPKPLSLTEVFPGGDLSPAPGVPPYRVTMTHIDTDCEIAATGTLRGVLADQDCSQLIRAGLIAPYGGYQVTAGVFNLADEVAVAEVGRQVRDHVESGAGSFAAMGVPATAPPSQVGWHERGHYLLYCVITRPGGEAVDADDPYARRITTDLLESYLSERTIGARTSGS